MDWRKLGLRIMQKISARVRESAAIEHKTYL